MMPTPSLIRRFSSMVRRDPAALRSLVRMAYRQSIGIPLDRRLRPGFSAPPTSLSVNLTMRCNLTCRMCRRIHNGQEVPENRPWYRKDRELPLETWTSLLDQAAPFRPWLYVTGGEPLLYPRFEEFVEYAKKRGFPLQLQTNGTLLKGAAEFLVRVGVNAVTVSVDGTPGVHDRIRGMRGSFQRLEVGIRALIEAREALGSPTPILNINCTISKGNVDVIPDMVPLATELGVDTVQIQHTMFNSMEKVTRHNQSLSRLSGPDGQPKVRSLPILSIENYDSEMELGNLPRLKAALEKARRQARGRMLLTMMPRIPEGLLEPYYFNLDYPFKEGCDSYWQVLRVLADGTVSPCLNFIVGDIREQSLQEIWNAPPMQELRRSISQGLFPGCARCCHRHFDRSNHAL